MTDCLTVLWTVFLQSRFRCSTESEAVNSEAVNSVGNRGQCCATDRGDETVGGREKCASCCIVSHCDHSIWTPCLHGKPEVSSYMCNIIRPDSWALEKRPLFVPVRATCFSRSPNAVCSDIEAPHTHSDFTFLPIIPFVPSPILDHIFSHNPLTLS